MRAGSQAVLSPFSVYTVTNRYGMENFLSIISIIGIAITYPLYGAVVLTMLVFMIGFWGLLIRNKLYEAFRNKMREQESWGL